MICGSCGCFTLTVYVHHAYHVDLCSPCDEHARDPKTRGMWLRRPVSGRLYYIEPEHQVELERLALLQWQN